MAGTKLFWKSLLIILIFTALDYIVHLTGILPHPDILPANYFINKIIFGTILLWASYMIIKTEKIWIHAALVAGLLQLRYVYTQNYNNFVMIGVHYILIIAAAYLYSKFISKERLTIY